MKRSLFIFLLLFLTACGPSVTPTRQHSVTDVSVGGNVVLTASPIPSLAFTPTESVPSAEPATPTEVIIPTETAIPTETFTPYPTQTPDLPTPTETPLPTLDLPEVNQNQTRRLRWSGLPTYSGDSNPNFMFILEYNPKQWGQTDGNFGDTVLGHRNIPGCVITPWSGRGLPLAWKVEHDPRLVGDIFVDFSQVFANDQLQFVTYTMSNKQIVTSFQVSFVEQVENCIAAAEEVIYTFRTASGAPTPTPFPESLSPNQAPEATEAFSPTPGP